ncbi:MAG: tRNA (adenosine(37)-N6)-threonylcarbamoyltransferase complex transferase subunit TsaD [Lentisphaeria bacterium]|nr:tRNA (adenosine(37)-N6)-threonylcarbamoyltransferase complex transferase subunit TsaD [Lentisphaeria bacterium]
MALILGIESSCDETAVAVVKDGFEVLSSAIASQIASHAQHGGVVPELAAREHLIAIDHVMRQALNESGVALNDIDAIAVTQGPGLMPALLVGLNYAKGLAVANNLPIIGVNHFLGHIYSAFLGEGYDCLLQAASYPMLALVVSGGHTSLMLIKNDGSAIQLGMTIDDAAGEALDKASKLLGLGYPGGPIIQKTAANGNASAIAFPRPLTGGAGKALSEANKHNFSFSGIKTALLYYVKNNLPSCGKFSDQEIADIAASYQEAVIDVLTAKTMQAAREYGVKTVVLCGGVACNGPLRDRFAAKVPHGVKLQLAARKNCTDNAAMIGGVGYHHFINGEFSELTMDSFARLPRVTMVPFVHKTGSK